MFSLTSWKITKAYQQNINKAVFCATLFSLKINLKESFKNSDQLDKLLVLLGQE